MSGMETGFNDENVKNLTPVSNKTITDSNVNEDLNLKNKASV